MLTLAQLKAVMPSFAASKAREEQGTEYISLINKYAADFGCNTSRRMAYFLATLAVESAEMKVMEENLSYSASRLRQVFPKYFPTAALAASYQYHPDKIGNRVYANRYGNGDEKSGDGYRFRGRGFIQITFRDNYKAYSDYLRKGGMDVDLCKTPELLSKPLGAIKSALWYCNTHKCWQYADKDNAVAFRKAVNGGTNGLKEFQSYLVRAKSAIQAPPQKVV